MTGRLAALVLLVCLLAPPAPAAQAPAPAAGPETALEALPGRRKVPLALLEAVRLALTQNVAVKKGLLDRAVQRMDLALAERLFEPEFYLKGGYEYDSFSNSDTRGAGVEIYQRIMTAGELKFDWRQDNVLNRDASRFNNPSRLSVTLTKPLLKGAGVTVGTAEVVTARNNEAINALEFEQLVIDRVTAVQESYWNLLLALENRMTASRSLEASLDIKRRNELLIRAGRMPAADLVQAEQEVAARRVDVLEQEFAAQAANQQLVLLLDLDEQVSILPVEGMVYRPVEAPYETMVRQALEHNRPLQQTRLRLRQRELDLELARSNAKDQVDLVVGSTVNADADTTGRAADQAWDLGQGWNLGLGFRIPLGLPRDRLAQQVRVAAKDLEQAKLDLHQSTMNVRQDVLDRANDVARSLRQISLAQTSRSLAQQKYEIELARLELGRSSNFQVLSYQRDLSSAMVSEHRAIVNYLVSLARLDAAVGTALHTWNVKVEDQAPAKITELNLRGLGQGQALRPYPTPGPAR